MHYDEQREEEKTKPWLMQGDCLERMKEIESGSIDLTVTSPPYDNLRSYNGNNEQWGEHVWKGVIKELYRVTVDGGVVVWVVADKTHKGSESGTSFKQALHAMECGFNLHDTMIWNKPDTKPLTHKRYEQSFEYMFIFCKGNIRIFNGIKDKRNKWTGTKAHGTHRCFDGTTARDSGHNKKVISDFGLRHNTWVINTVKTREHKHPAIFPESLANDHIISWSNKGDVVFDPFMGSGTTGKMAKLNGRNFIGIEIDESYFKQSLIK